MQRAARGETEARGEKGVFVSVLSPSAPALASAVTPVGRCHVGVFIPSSATTSNRVSLGKSTS